MSESDLAGCAHAHGNDAGQKAGGDSQARAFGDVVHAADDLNAIAGLSGEALQQSGERLRCPFDARRDDAAGNDTRFEQSQVVAGKVEDLGDGRNVGGSAQVDAGQADDRLIDHPEPRFDWRPGLRA